MKINSERIDINNVLDIISNNERIELSEELRQRVADCRTYLDDKLSHTDQVIYGVNTGFGSLCDVVIDKKNLTQLQKNLIRSHACGVGDRIPKKIAKLILYLKILNLSKGYSGVSNKLLELLIFFFNNDIVPVIYEYGSLGASGDLAPLAHLALLLMGEGEVYYKNEIVSSASLVEKEIYTPIELQSKEGIALLNGTQFSTAFTAISLIDSLALMRVAKFTAALTIIAFDGDSAPYDSDVHRIRNQLGQIEIAKYIRDFLQTNSINSGEIASVQDPYSLRCTPQVLGASQDTIDYVKTIVERELNAVTDNPNIFAHEDKIISSGNFHAQPIAFVADFLKIAVSEIASISERRGYKLLSGERGLPAFLVKNSGINSGMMIPQYTAASMVSQNKTLCAPSSVDSITSSNGQEDHVSMGANASVNCLKVVNNSWRVVAIEFLLAMQALDFRKHTNLSDQVKSIHKEYRKEVPFVEEDMILYKLMNKTEMFLRKLADRL